MRSYQSKSHTSEISALCCSLLLVVACSEPDALEAVTCLDPGATPSAVPKLEPAFESETLSVYIEPPHFLCAGSLVELDRWVALVEDELAVTSVRPVPLYLVERPGDWCSSQGNIGGCVTRDGTAFATPRSMHHELAHTIACQIRSGAPAVLAEGLAVSFESREHYVRGDPQTFAEIDDFAMYYQPAGHFVRWLRSELTPDSFHELYRTANYDSGIWSAIEAAYGPTLADDYETQSPALWVPYRQCADLPLIEPSGSGWTLDAHLDCDDPSTMGPYVRRYNANTDLFGRKAMYQGFLIEVETPGNYIFQRPDFATEGPTDVRVERCLTDHPATEAEIESQWVKDRPFFTSQDTSSVELAHTGLWRVDVLRERGPAVDVTLTITAAP